MRAGCTPFACPSRSNRPGPATAPSTTHSCQDDASGDKASAVIPSPPLPGSLPPANPPTSPANRILQNAPAPGRYQRRRSERCRGRAVPGSASSALPACRGRTCRAPAGGGWGPGCGGVVAAGHGQRTEAAGVEHLCGGVGARVWRFGGRGADEPVRWQGWELRAEHWIWGLALRLVLEVGRLEGWEIGRLGGLKLGRLVGWALMFVLEVGVQGWEAGARAGAGRRTGKRSA
eukprot:357423-Chlamydomonas_euryale.AAC.3